MAAFVPSAVEMIVVWREAAKPLRLVPERGAAGPQPATDRFTFGPDWGRNALERSAGRFQPCGFLIARLPARVGILTALLGCRRFGGIEWGRATLAPGTTASSAICLATRRISTC